MEEGAHCSIKGFLDKSPLANRKAASKHCQTPDWPSERSPYHEDTE